MRVVVDKPGTVLDALQRKASSLTPTALKKKLKHGVVVVNGVEVRRADHAVVPGDVIEIDRQASAPLVQGGLRVLHYDRDVVVVEKPAGLLSVPNDTDDGRPTALTVARQLLVSREKNTGRLYAVHRLDRETSGVLLLARSVPVREAIMSSWDDVEKRYLAVIEGSLDVTSGAFSERVRELPNLKVIVDNAHPDSKDARQSFRVVDESRMRSLVEVTLDTGRKHQIRVLFAHIGHPVVGDEVYGKSEGGFNRHALHAMSLSFVHPSTRARVTFRADMPATFTSLMRR